MSEESQIPIQKARSLLSDHAEPLSRHADRDAIEAFGDQLDGVEAMLDADGLCTVALVGTTGAGKSTLLNALLGHEILPVGVMTPCTSFATIVKSSKSDPLFRISVEYCTREEWMDEARQLAEILNDDEGSAHQDELTKWHELLRAAKKKLSAVYAIPAADLPQPFDAVRCPLSPEAEEVLNAESVQSIEAEDARGIRKFLSKLVRDSSHIGPLIKSVRVTGPFSTLPDGVQLVDLPGLNDPNRLRVEETRNFLNRSPNIWVVFSMKRGITDDVQKILSERNLLRRLVMTGRYESLALVGTHADDIDTNLAESLGFDEDEPPSQHDLIQTYRQKAVDEIRNQVSQMMEDLRQPGDDPGTIAKLKAFAGGLPVFATSAQAFVRLAGINKQLQRDHGIDDEQGTGLPDLIEHLQEVGRAQGATARFRDAAELLVQAVESFAAHIKSRANRESSGQAQRATTAIQQKLDALASRLDGELRGAEAQFQAFREAFLDSMKPAFQHAVRGVGRKMNGWQGIHWGTLRATVRRDGCFISPSTGMEYDLNEDLCEPLLEQLPVKWEHFFNDQITSVVAQLCARAESEAASFGREVETVVQFAFEHPPGDTSPMPLDGCLERIGFLRRKTSETIASHVRERRGDLSINLGATAKSDMLPAYADAKEISGPGMKQRILDTLRTRGSEIATPLHNVIEADLTEGVSHVWLEVRSSLKELLDGTLRHCRTLADEIQGEMQSPSLPPEAESIVGELRNLSESIARTRTLPHAASSQ
jgi:energy-coupling factor transporter ATP-binding protein EcfA2